jgi:hypothetical protein
MMTRSGISGKGLACSLVAPGVSNELLLGHTTLESTVRYLGIEVDYAISISKQAQL